jgi:hypothetical protein
MTANTTDLYTTVKNTSGAAMVFGFLSKHGRRLDADATYTVPGDLVGALGAQRSQRQFQALERALLSGDLTIVKSPSVYLRSEDDDATKELALGTTDILGTTVPSWQGGGSFAQAAGASGATGATGVTGVTGVTGATGVTGPVT